MTITYEYRETIWPIIKAALDHLQTERKDGMPAEVRAGVNFSIILGSACYLEGVLETGLKALLRLRRVIYGRMNPKNFETRRSMNLFYNRIDDDLEGRICSAMGAAGYDEMFELLTGERLSKLSQVVPLWEGITVLFQVRNVLGHDREVMAEQIVSPTPARELFSGGYRHAEDYLRKRKLLGKKFTEAHSEYLFLSDPVADHFWELTKQVPRAVSKSLKGLEKRKFETAAGLIRTKAKS
jgi:hypothetical protein